MNKIRHSKKYIVILFILFFYTALNRTFANDYKPIESLIQQTMNQKKISLNFTRKPIQEVLTEIKKQSGVGFAISEDVKNDLGVVTINVKSASVREILDILLKNTSYEYKIVNDQIILQKKVENENISTQKGKINLVGKLVDTKNQPIIGATILIKGTDKGAISDNDGAFSLSAEIGNEIEIHCTGMKSITRKISGTQDLLITLEADILAVDDVVVTGIFNRKASSFTGSAVTMNKEELMKVGNQNLFASLKNIDASLMIFDNLNFGSDPNKMPDMQLRGTSSFPASGDGLDLKGNYAGNANLPLFILDGFEASVEKIFDLDMNRVESVTILKDASAKAIYGSKAANGVVVIETQRLESGNMRISYNGSIDITAPDLSSYDLCSPAEKLELERKYGLYESDNIDTRLDLLRQYNRRKSAIESGIETNWMAKPLQVGIGHKHNLSIELGNNDLRLVADFTYNNVVGVMKGSDRTNVAGTVSISYRHKNFTFRDVLSVTANNSSDSPYGSFSDYSRMNPYWTPVDQYGNIVKNAEISINEFGEDNIYPNPLFNSTLNTKLTTEYVDVTNNLYAEWNVLQGLKAVVRFGITKKQNSADTYYPANHLSFKDYTGDDFFRRGSYQKNEGKAKVMSGDFNVNYSKQFGEKNYIFGNVGFNLNENNYQELIYQAEGLPSDRMDDIMFARQYAKDSKPNGSEELKRDIGVLAVFNYSYDNRFLLDASYRTSASSQFGDNNRWGSFWSAGAGWNIHNEKWMINDGVFDQLKLRGSVGYTGSQNSGAYQAMATYKYYMDKTYEGALGAYLVSMANPNLKWQRKLDYNIGLDMNILKKLSLKFDYYIGITDNTLIDLTLPPSVGYSSVKENMGKIKNNGFEARLSYTAFSRPKDRTYITISASVAANKNKILAISNALESYNKAQDAKADDRYNNKPVTKYYEGASMNSIWAVRSNGIDPANGKEVYIKRDGTPTYTYSSSDLVVCGDELPKLSGNFAVNFEYKGFGLNVVFRYQYGAKMYNQTLVDRVENVDMAYNVDRRVLFGRWQNVGDEKPYKSLQKVYDFSIPPYGAYVSEVTQATSRFVQKRNELDLSSINLSYDFYRFSFIKKIGMERLKCSFYMNDVVKFSSIKVERGLYYPFARSFNFSLQVTF